MTNTPETTEENAVSTKRQVAAVVATTATTVVLGVGAQLLIGKVAGKVHNLIIPQNQDETK